MTTSRAAETSPRTKARIAGLLYLVITVAAPFGELYVRGRLIAKGDAAATAANIAATSCYTGWGAALIWSRSPATLRWRCCFTNC